MKKGWLKRSLGALLAAALVLGTVSTPAEVKGASGVALTSEVFPDEEVLSEMWRFDSDGDGELSKSEIAEITSLEFRSISDVSWVEYLTSLKSLTVFNCSFKTLTLPTAKKLTKLCVFNNSNLTKLDLKNAPNLKTIEVCDNPKLKTLDLSKNTKLTYAACQNNALTSLDCSKNTKLTSLQCYNNKLTSLNVKKTSALRCLSCQNNKLKTLDLSKNISLREVYCYGNPLKKLYVKNKTNALKKVSVTPSISNAKQATDSSITVKLKSKKKGYIYYVVAETDECPVYRNSWLNDEGKAGETEVYGLFDNDPYTITAAGGVTYQEVNVYAKATTYKKKITLSRSY